ncbi:MAG: peptidoglycan DD-metalloendopeptidase family protein [Deltaproteobacteria bacterium]|nr:peptidoglycan DD-metalloendopeptidase family protein [Deltaproteobacteria bacterium]
MIAKPDAGAARGKIPPVRSSALRFGPRGLIWPFLLLLLWDFSPFFVSPPKALAAPSVSQLEKNLARERERAAARRAGLKRLTEQERQINASLAEAEDRVLRLESGLEAQQKRLLELARNDDSSRLEYESLLEEQGRTEKALAGTLRLLWEIACGRLAAGSRNTLDWAETDREYAWTQGLYLRLEGHRRELAAREIRLAEVLGRRQKLALEIRQRLKAVEEEKNALLQNRVAYEQRLAALRRERLDTEAELESVLKLADSLNMQIAKASVDIAKLKGRLPWPVAGTLRQKYAPAASPPSRGLGFASAEGAAVQAVAAGKVVHNNVLRGFGTVLILQHGEEYYSLYAFLGGSPLKVGEEVLGRQRIGTSGYYPAVNGSGMYFELRFKQKAINPEQWLAPS